MSDALPSSPRPGWRSASPAGWEGSSPTASRVRAACCTTPSPTAAQAPRRRSQAPVDAADLVTAMEAVKHPYRAGVTAQAGIED